jgi:quercetin dioxygenase-like cupin family protein
MILHKSALFCIGLLSLFLSFSCKKTPSLPDPLKAGWQGQVVCELIEENSEVRILKCRFPPNVGHEKHYHPPHFGYTLSGGKFKIIEATKTREVEIPTGYSFNNDTIVIHEVVNIGDSTAEFLIIEYK